MTGTLVQTAIEARPEGRIARVTIDNAKRANCLGRATNEAIRDAFRELAADSDLRLAVLTGAGDRSFSAGADLNELGSADEAAGRAYITASSAERRVGKECVSTWRSRGSP